MPITMKVLLVILSIFNFSSLLGQAEHQGDSSSTVTKYVSEEIMPVCDGGMKQCYEDLNDFIIFDRSINGTIWIRTPNTVRYPVTFNNEKLTKLMLATLEKTAGKENVMLIPAIAGAEDFSFFAQKVPGLYFSLGCYPKGKI